VTAAVPGKAAVDHAGMTGLEGAMTAAAGPSIATGAKVHRRSNWKN
jgi:hypothetical protein